MSLIPDNLDDCTNRAASDNAGTGCSGLHKNFACAELTNDLVGDRSCP